MNPKKAIKSFNDLVYILREVFVEDKVEVEEVKEIMSNYQSKASEWREYAYFDRHRYTRNLIDTGNGKYNLILICWSPGQGSSIHDHANSHCFMKIMSGSLVEKRFAIPEQDKTINDEVNQMKFIGDTHFKLDEVAYINDSIGLHRVENRSHVEPAVSLHLYVPPINVCRIFDERTGKSNYAKSTFFSENGKRTCYTVAEDKGFLMFENN